MMHDLLLGLGLVAIVEGLVLALAPLRIRELLEALEKISPEHRRNLGLVVVAMGVGLVWLAKI